MNPEELRARNRAWADSIAKTDPDLLCEIAHGQRPKHLWIGCSDSRVAPSKILNMNLGVMFEHRNIANQALAGDENCQSVIEFATDGLKVENIIVCGHHRCAGVEAVIEGKVFGGIAHWLERLSKLHSRSGSLLAGIPDLSGKVRRLSQLNVIDQVLNLAENPLVKKVWDNGRDLKLHGWVFECSSGRILPPLIEVDGEVDREAEFAKAVDRLGDS